MVRRVRVGGGTTFNAGAVVATLTLNDTLFMQKLSGANTALEASRREMTRRFGAIRDSINTAANGMLAFGAAASVGVAGLAKLGMQFEQTFNAFKHFTGSAEAAKATLDELYTFAENTPFKISQVTDQARQLQAYRFELSEIVPLLTDIGDAVSGVGGGEEGLNRVVRALGQVQVKGRVMAQEMLQLTEAGIPAWRYLAEAMGTSTSEVMKLSEKGLIPASKAIEAIRAGMRQDFGGLMAEQAQTAAGQLSNLQDQLERVGTTMGTALIPAANQFIAVGQKFADVLGQMSDGQKAALGTTALWVAGITLGIGVIAKATLGIQSLWAGIKGLIALQAAHTATVAQNRAAVAAYGVELQAVAAAEILAAEAALAAAAALEAEAVATGGANTAAMEYVAAERAKATAALDAAKAMQAEGAALAKAGAAGRAAFLGLSPAAWGVVAAIGAVVLAYKAYEYAQGAATRQTEALLDQAERARTAKEAELKQLDTEKLKRQTAAAELKRLGDEYERLSNKSNRTQSEQTKLAAVKKDLAERMRGIREELGLQIRSWDGTATSIRAAIAALQDFTDTERKIATLKAELDAKTTRTDTLKARAEREKAQAALDAVRNQYDLYLQSGVDTATPNGAQARKTYKDAITAAEDQLTIAKIEESYALALQEAARERQRTVKDAIAKGTWKPAEGTSPTPEPPLPGVEGAKRKRSIAEQLKLDLLAVEEQAKAAERAGQAFDRLKAKYGAYQKALDAYLTPDSDRGPLSVNDARVTAVVKELRALQPELLLEERATKLRELAEEERKTRRMLLEEEALGLGLPIERQRSRVEGLTAILRSYLPILGAEHAQVRALDEERLRAVQTLAEMEQRLRANAEAGSALADAQGMLRRGTDASAESLLAMLDRLSAQLAVMRALQNPTAEEIQQLFDLNAAWTQVAGTLHTVSEREADQASWAERRKLLLDEIAAEARWREEFAEAIVRQEERIRDARMATFELEQRQVAARMRTLEELAATLREGEEARLGAAIETLPPELSARVLGDQRAALQNRMDDLRTYIRLGEMGRLPGADEATIARKKIELQKLEAQVDALDRKIADLGKKDGAAPDVWAGFADRLADVLWDATRDKGAITSYFREAARIASKALLVQWWETMTKPGEGGAESPLEDWMRKAGIVDQTGTIFGMISANGVREGLLPLIGSAQAIQEGEGGVLGGAIAGGTAALALEKVLGTTLGPAGMAAGALIGAMLGGNAERKRAEERAQRLREEQLAELRKMRNALAAVTDYFRSLTLNLLPSNQTFGVGLETSYAVISARGG